MLPEEIRVSVKLETGREAESFLEALEQALGRPVKPIHIVKTARVISLLVTRAELEKLRLLPGVTRAAEEGRKELPPRPKGPRHLRS